LRRKGSRKPLENVWIVHAKLEALDTGLRFRFEKSICFHRHV
jgi:hypothetical protein